MWVDGGWVGLVGCGGGGGEESVRVNLRYFGGDNKKI